VGIHIRIHSEVRIVPPLGWENIIASPARFVRPRERVDGGAEETKSAEGFSALFIPSAFILIFTVNGHNENQQGVENNQVYNNCVQ